MRRRAKLPAKNRNLLLRILIKTLKILIIFTILGAAYITLVLVSQRYDCVVLPNGATITYSYFWRSSEEDPGYSTMTLRDADGKVLTRSNRYVDLIRNPADKDEVILKYGDEDGQEIRFDGHGLMRFMWDEGRHGREWNEPDKDFPNKTRILFTDLRTIHYHFTECTVFKTVKQKDGSHTTRSHRPDCSEFRKVGCKMDWSLW